MTTPFQLQSQLLPPILLLIAAAEIHLILGTTADEPPMTIALPNCDDKCGNISVPYPFGMADGCFLPGFQVICNRSSDTPRAFLASAVTEMVISIQPYHTRTTDYINYEALSSYPRLPTEIFNLSAAASEAWVYVPVAVLCSQNSTYRTIKWGVTRLDKAAPLRLSTTRNVAVAVGYPVHPKFTDTTLRTDVGYELSCVTNKGSTQQATDGSCTGWGCCVTTLPRYVSLTDFRTFGSSLVLENTDSWATSPCSYAMLVEQSWYNFSRHDLEGHLLADRFPRGVPAVLEFAMANASCPAVVQPRPPGYACLSDNTTCVNVNSGQGYVCKCIDNYHGNPYVPNGCRDINECDFPQLNNCSKGSRCINTPGSYECPCISGFRFNANRGRCEEAFPLPAKVAIGLAGLVIVVLLIVVASQLLKLKRLYKQNGGDILEGIKNIRIYTKKQLKRITNNYNHAIGVGQFGKVYKGTDLKDKQHVAVKKSIKVDKAMKKEFTDEIKLQSGMRHKNIVRLLGCCLQMDVPMLVYEFVANGSLYDVLFKKRESIPVDTRLRIAIGSAEGLAYMHSSVESTIRHGDVKSGNILLDENFTPKISDFGTSKLLARGKSEKTGWVTGDKGYIDPVYMEHGIVTQKNDVYSFGIVLIELITRRPATYDEKRSYVTNFVEACLDQGARNFVDNDVRTEKDVKLLEMVSGVAVDCLKPDPDERPDMKKIEQRLHMIGQSAQLGQQSNYQGSFSPAPDDVPLFKATE